MAQLNSKNGQSAKTGAVRHPAPGSRLVVPAILCLAAVLRLINANADLWYDEIVTATHFVPVPLASVVTYYRLANNHVMNSALTNIVGSTLGTDPWMLRLPAVAFGVAGVWAFWFVARVLWPRRPAQLGTLLIAVSYHHIYYSQNARGYSAFMFFALLATGCLLRFLAAAPRQWRHAAGYGLAIGLGLYSMLLTAFVAVGHALVLGALRQWRALAWLAAGVACAAALYAPMAGSLIEYYRTGPEETGHPLLSVRFVQVIAPVAAALFAAGVVMLPVVLRFARRRPMAAALLLAPAAVNVLLPLLRGQGVYPRTFLYVLCVGYLLLVEALDWALERRPRLAWAGVALLAAASLTSLVPFYQLPKQGFRRAVAYVDHHAAGSDARVGLTLGGKAARFYDPRFVLVEQVEQLETVVRQGRPAWVITTFHGALHSSSPELYQWLHSEGSLRGEFDGVVGDGTVYVHYWPGASPPR